MVTCAAPSRSAKATNPRRIRASVTSLNPLRRGEVLANGPSELAHDAPLVGQTDVIARSGFHVDVRVIDRRRFAAARRGLQSCAATAVR
jgi:hypothetical protein